MTADGASPLRSVVEVIARALVDKPDSVRVAETERRGMTVLELTTAPGDMGKIIGRQGRTAAALRTKISRTTPRTPASIEFMSFMTSMMHRVVSGSTDCPTSTNGGSPGAGAR